MRWISVKREGALARAPWETGNLGRGEALAAAESLKKPW
jgi:hypothetical protein